MQKKTKVNKETHARQGVPVRIWCILPGFFVCLFFLLPRVYLLSFSLKKRRARKKEKEREGNEKARRILELHHIGKIVSGIGT